MDLTPVYVASGTIVGASISAVGAIFAARVNKNVGQNGGSSIHQRLDKLQELLVDHVTDDGRHWVE